MFMSTSEDMLRSQYALEGPLPHEPPFENDLKFLAAGFQPVLDSGSDTVAGTKDEESTSKTPASPPSSRPSDNRFIREEPW